MQINVTSTATRIDDGLTENFTLPTKSLLIRDASATIFLGGADVTTGTGFPVKTTDGVLTVQVPTTGLYAITATTATAQVL